MLRLKLAVPLVIGALWLLPGSASAAIAEVSPEAFTLTSTQVARVAVAFPGSPRPVASVCFHFSFGKGGLVPEEEVTIEIGRPGLEFIGFKNATATPSSPGYPEFRRTVCIRDTEKPLLADKFDDGHQVIRVRSNGPLTITKLGVSYMYE
jgi:hypothetical protein